MRFQPLYALLFFGSVTFAQTERGSMMLHLDGFLQHTDYQQQDYLSGFTELEAGYAFFDNFFLGAKYVPDYSSNLDGEHRFTLPGYGLFSRYYFLKNKNRIFLQASMFHVSGHNYNINRMDTALGFNHFLSNNAALEVRLNYNFYNRYKSFSPPKNPTNPNPIFIDQDQTTGLDLSFGFKFFLPAAGTKTSKEQLLPLVERYLKKDNKAVGLTGLGGYIYERIWTIGIFEKSRFLSNRLRLRHQLEGSISLGGSGSSIFQTYTTRLTPYLPITKRLFFVPSIGVGPMLWAGKILKNNHLLGWSGHAQIGVVQFLNSSKIETGVSFDAKDFFKQTIEMTLSGTLYLSSEFFISEQLAIKPTLYYNLLEYPTSLPLYRGDRQVYFQSFYMQFGFSYFY